MRARHPKTQAKERNGSSGRTLAAALVAAVSAGALLSQADAQTPTVEAATSRMWFDISAQPLTSALSEFARQSGVQVLYPYEQLRDISAPSVRGVFSRDEALARVLAGSGYFAVIDEAGAVRLENRDRPQRVRAETQRADDAAAGASPATAGVSEATQSENSSQEEIVVTGTRIRGVPPVGANVETLDRDDIEATGRSTLQDVLATLPQNFLGAQGELTQLGALDARRNIAFGSTVDLRGLGADATLSLVNGRRLAPAGFGNFVDISIVPLSAVERVEVLPDGASATYGADAVGGVVNVILRDDYQGADSSLRFAGAADMTEIAASHLLGFRWNTGQAMAGYEYRQRDGLEAADRGFTASSDLRRFGGSDFSRVGGNPGNIIRVGTTTVSLPIPGGQDGTALSQPDLVTGPLHLHNENEDDFLLPEQSSHSLFGSLRQSVGEDVEFFAEGLATERSAYAERAQTTANLVVPQTNAYRQLNNLFPGAGNLTIAYWMGEDLGPIVNDTTTRSLSSAAGARIDFPVAWQLEASIAYAHHEDHSAFLNQFESSGGIVAALASSTLATAFNPFGDGSNTNSGVLETLTVDSIVDTDADIVTYAVKADGPLFRLWGGHVRAAFGVERREESFTLDRVLVRSSGVTPDFVQAPGERTTDAAFAELYAPIFGPQNEIPLLHELTLSLSVRQEDPSDFETAVTPRYGLLWAPFADLSLRAAWGQSFKAPQFQQMLGGVGGTLFTATAAQDPFATNGSTGVLSLSGSNRLLRPERADVWTTGFDFEPSWLSGLSVEATYFDIDFADRISGPGSIAAGLRDSTGLESVFFRNPTQAQIDFYLGLADDVSGSMPVDGIEVIFDRRLTNLASLRVRGVDLGATYHFDTVVGEFSAALSASGLLQYESVNTPGASPIEALDTIYNPVDWRGRGLVSWRNGGWAASLAINYVDDYRDTTSTPNRRIKSWTTADFRLSHEWRSSDADPATSIALSMQNLFDRDPPFANSSIGYGFDSANASPVGRFIALEVRRSW